LVQRAEISNQLCKGLVLIPRSLLRGNSFYLVFRMTIRSESFEKLNPSLPKDFSEDIFEKVQHRNHDERRIRVFKGPLRRPCVLRDTPGGGYKTFINLT